MNSLWQFLDKPFTELRLEQQLLTALVIVCCVAVAICTVVFAARRIRPARLHERRAVGRPVLVSWRDSVGPKKSDEGFCQDVSAGGMAVELPFPLKVRTRLSLRLSEAKMSGVGVVRRCTRVGPRFVVGVKFDRLTRALMS